MSHAKPNIEEWLSWATLVVERLSDCAHIYSGKEAVPTSVFMSETERQHKTATTVALLRRIYILVDEAETPTDSIADAHIHDEQIISGLAVLFVDTLKSLPEISADMQRLLESSWHSKFPGKTAQILFFGTKDAPYGIGSGDPEHGRLPAILTDLLEREQVGDNRQPRKALLHQGEPRRHDPDSRRRWAEQNSKFLRSAGRVE